MNELASIPENLKGGQLLPSFVPHNYTATCWCDLFDGEGKEELLMRLDDLNSSIEDFASAAASSIEALAAKV